MLVLHRPPGTRADALLATRALRAVLVGHAGGVAPFSTQPTLAASNAKSPKHTMPVRHMRPPMVAFEFLRSWLGAVPLVNRSLDPCDGRAASTLCRSSGPRASSQFGDALVLAHADCLARQVAGRSVPRAPNPGQLHARFEREARAGSSALCILTLSALAQSLRPGCPPVSAILNCCHANLREVPPRRHTRRALLRVLRGAHRPGATRRRG